MSERAIDLADAFGSVAAETANVVSESSEQEWSAVAPDGDWTVAFETYHIAIGMEFQHRWISALTRGETIEPLSIVKIDEMNRQEAVEHAIVDRTIVASLLETNSQLVQHHITSLTDPQLEKTYPQSSIFQGAPDDETFSVDWLIEFIYIGHVLSHLERVHEAVDAIVST